MRKIAFKPVLLTEKADIFSIWINDNPFTEFQKFVICFKGSSDPFIADDLERILASIRTIGNKGALENQSRPEGQLLILGGGGIKTTDTYEENESLLSQVSLLQEIDKQLFLMETNGKDLASEIYNLTLFVD